MPARIKSECLRLFLGDHGGAVTLSKLHVNRKDTFFPPASPAFPIFYPPYNSGETNVVSSSSPSSGMRISPAVIFIIVILAALFFVSGLLHLLVRFLVKSPSSNSSQSNDGYPEIPTQDALQRQLQQLFHLHDSGLDQAFIDALPVFLYREVVGLKEPFDCAVCLCEFSDKDKLRLLPMCSHAFHIHCIDTWLLSNSSCPLCRGTLISPGGSIQNPMYEDIRDSDLQDWNTDHRPNQKHKSVGTDNFVSGKEILSVKLGKFRKLNDEPVDVGETSSSNLNARRCFSMGSYQYVVGDSDLSVSFRRVRDVDLSEDGDLRSEVSDEGGYAISVARGESFSTSKIWQWPKKDNYPSSLATDLPWKKEMFEQ